MNGQRIGVIGLVLAVLTVVGAVAEPAQKETAVQAVVRLEEARRQAMVAGDIEAMTRLLAPDATYVHSTGLEQSRDDLLGVMRRGEIRYRSFDVESASYRTYGSTVVGTGVQTLDVEASGKSQTFRSRYTVVYVPIEGELRLVAYQSTALPMIVMEKKISDE